MAHNIQYILYINHTNLQEINQTASIQKLNKVHTIGSIRLQIIKKNFSAFYRLGCLLYCEDRVLINCVHLFCSACTRNDATIFEIVWRIASKAVLQFGVESFRVLTYLETLIVICQVLWHKF